MEIDIFVLRFKICVRGLGFKLRVGLLRFLQMGVFVRSLQIWFLKDQLLVIFKILNLGFKILMPKGSLQSLKS